MRTVEKRKPDLQGSRRTQRRLPAAPPDSRWPPAGSSCRQCLLPHLRLRLQPRLPSQSPTQLAVLAEACWHQRGARGNAPPTPAKRALASACGDRRWRFWLASAVVLLMIIYMYFTEGCGGLDCGDFECSGLASAQCVIPDGVFSLGDMIMRSGYNGALVQAVTYTGEATTLSWELQYSLCAAAGRATPGSDLSGWGIWDGCSSRRSERWDGSERAGDTDCLDKVCAYSANDNHVVADGCGWVGQEFTHVSGSLGGGVGWMCAESYLGIDCIFQVRVEGTAVAPHNSYCAEVDHRLCDDGAPQVTLNSGDAVFCSA